MCLEDFAGGTTAGVGVVASGGTEAGLENEAGGKAMRLQHSQVTKLLLHGRHDENCNSALDIQLVSRAKYWA
jgi:hypothetical protein